jgi:hypothetical protein
MNFVVPPKFPLPVKLALLLRMGVFPETVRDIIGKQECEAAEEMAITTLVVCTYYILDIRWY